MTFSAPMVLLFLAIPVIIAVFAWQHRGWGHPSCERSKSFT